MCTLEHDYRYIDIIFYRPAFFLQYLSVPINVCTEYLECFSDFNVRMNPVIQQMEGAVLRLCKSNLLPADAEAVVTDCTSCSKGFNNCRVF